MEQRDSILALLRGLAGGVAGGVAGYFVFSWLTGQGLYALALPGALLGLGCGWASRQKSIVLGVLCAVMGLALGIVCDWRVKVPIGDGSLWGYVMNLHQRSAMTLIFLALGVLLAYWFGLGRQRAR